MRIGQIGKDPLLKELANPVHSRFAPPKGRAGKGAVVAPQRPFKLGWADLSKAGAGTGRLTRRPDTLFDPRQSPGGGSVPICAPGGRTDEGIATMTTRQWLTSAGLAAALWSGPAFAQGPGGDWMWGFDRGGMMGGGGLTMVLFWGVIIFLVVLSARWFDGRSLAHHHGNAQRQTALEILEERFARGEIDKMDYAARRKTLGG